MTTTLPTGLTRITFDTNGVPRIRDTGVPVWQIVSRLYHECEPGIILEAFPCLHPEDITQAACYRADELQRFIRDMGHDMLTQVNAIFGFTELAQRGMLEQDEAHGLLGGVFRSNSRFMLHVLIFWGSVVNCTSEIGSMVNRFRAPVKLGNFLQALSKSVAQHGECCVNFVTDDSYNELLLEDDYDLQAALRELIKLSWFDGTFESECTVSVSGGEQHLRLVSQKRLKKQADDLDFLIRSSLSPIPIAAYILEQRGGSLSCKLVDDGVHFTVQLPLLSAVS